MNGIHVDMKASPGEKPVGRTLSDEQFVIFLWGLKLNIFYVSKGACKPTAFAWKTFNKIICDSINSDWFLLDRPSRITKKALDLVAR